MILGKSVGRGGEREEKAQKPKYFIFQVKVTIPENFTQTFLPKKPSMGRYHVFWNNTINNWWLITVQLLGFM